MLVKDSYSSYLERNVFIKDLSSEDDDAHYPSLLFP